MQPARIAELLAPFLSANPNSRHSESTRMLGEESAVLSSAQCSSISTYIDILLHWNARINLTAIRDPEEIVTRHFGESFFAARHLFPTTAHVETVPLGSQAEPSFALRVVDVGSGAGFPGIPIKLWAPHIALTLVESNYKKSTFLREVARALTLTDIDILNARAEAVTQTFNVVTLRAVERFADILPVATGLLASGARLALLIGSSQVDEACANANLSWRDPLPVPQSKSRVLLIGKLEPRR
jgi:16S rRNA (guanine527-N7)-methyltransferase